MAVGRPKLMSRNLGPTRGRRYNGGGKTKK